MENRLFIYAIISLCFFQCAQFDSEKNSGLNDLDIKEIRATRLAYTDGWMRNDSTLVLKSLTKDVVLIPHHGNLPIVGIDSVKAFWWPEDALPTKVKLFTSEIDEISGINNMAYVRGRFRLEFEYDAKVYSNEGNFVNILRKENENWKLSRLIWNDPVPNIE